MSTIQRFRGDTSPDVVNIQDAAGAVLNITGCTFLMTVDRRREPPDASTQAFQIEGLITDIPTGEVTFAPTLAQAGQTPGKYYYDIQMTNALDEIQTIQVGAYVIRQDITK